MRMIRPGRIIVKEWGAEKLCTQLQLLSINQMIIKFKLLEMWKIINVKGYPLQREVMATLNKNISESDIVTRSKAQNILRPILGNKTQRNNLVGQGIKLWNSSSNEFKNAATYHSAKRIANEIAKSYPIK